MPEEFGKEQISNDEEYNKLNDAVWFARDEIDNISKQIEALSPEEQDQDTKLHKLLSSAHQKLKEAEKALSDYEHNKS